jgi:Na+/H+-dicarboxylate symporter/ABC-type amino acid transport substrate-binding protein
VARREILGRVSLSKQILLGLLAGLVVGLFLGERASFLELPAKAFVQLLQVTVLPYVVSSLVAGVARGTPAQARRLASKGGLALGLLLALSLALVFLSPLALPPDKGGYLFATTELSSEPRIDWLDLYIPSNPFRSLANSVVPAVVVFSILLGVAILGLPGKERILGPLGLVNDALGRAGSLLVRLTPFGLFAIAGHSAGTLRLEEFERLQAFLLVYTGLATILTFWVLPGLVSTLTGLSYRRILSLAQDPLLTAFVTANLFIVLPLLAERGKTLLAEAGLDEQDSDEAVDVLVPASFTFPHSAKLLSLAFVLFAGWFVGAAVPTRELPSLAGAGLLSLFGSLNTAVPFLLDLVRLPADLFQLFIVSSVVNSRFGSAAAAMHTLVLALLGAHFMAGRLRVDRKRLLGFAGSSLLIVGGFLLGSRLLLDRVLPGPERTSAAIDRLRLTGAWGVLAPVEVRSEAEPPSVPPVRGQRVNEIKRRGSLRFGVTDDEIPWSFRNGRGEPVGLEADLAHALAVDLGLRLELVPVGRDAREQNLSSGACDVAAGRIKPDRAMVMQFSRPIAEEAWAFLVPDHARELFASLDRTQRQEGLRIAVLPVPEWITRLKTALPRAEVVTVDTILDFVNAPPERFDAMFTGYGRAIAQSLLHPRLAAVVPSPGLGSVPIAFTVPEGDEDLVQLVNAWLEQARASGLLEAKLDYWVRGKGARAEEGPRWSIGRDVLGWWKD